MTLPVSPTDGQIAPLRVSSGQDTTEFWMSWNASRSKWVGVDEWVAVRSTDQVGVLVSGSPITTKRFFPNTEQPRYAFDSISAYHYDLAFTAGLSLEYCEGAWIAGNGSQTMSVGAYFYQYNSGDYNTSNGLSTGSYTNPPTGGVAETAYLTSATSTTRAWVEQGWTTLHAPGGGTMSVTRTYLYPAMYAYMSTGASTSGTVWDYFLKLRWVM